MGSSEGNPLSGSYLSKWDPGALGLGSPSPKIPPRTLAPPGRVCTPAEGTGIQAPDRFAGGGLPPSASRWHESAQEPAMNPGWLGLGCRIRAEVWDGRRTQTRQPISFPS